MSDGRAEPEPSLLRVRRPSLRRRIRSAFFQQVAAIGLATVLGICGTYLVLDDVLIRRALVEEAGHFAARMGAQPGAALPDTHNLTGYLDPPRTGDPSVPPSLAALGDGYRSVTVDDRSALVHVSTVDGRRLFLVFGREHVNRLVLFFGFLPLSIVLLAIYLIVWMTYRASKRAVSPVIWLANQVQAWDPKRPDDDNLVPERLPPDAEGEVEVLAHALRRFAQSNQAYVARERNFTRDASHELRSPLTVIKIASDILLTEDALSPFAIRNVERIRRSARGMESLIEAFLILARESDTGLPIENFLANEVVLEEIDNARALVAGKPVNLRCEEQAQLELHAPPRVLAVVIGNLIRNACQHTDGGEVVVSIQADRIVVQDSGTGMSQADLQRAFEPFFRSDAAGARAGHGIGLTVVKRLADRFGWVIRIDSELGVGTTVTLSFNLA